MPGKRRTGRGLLAALLAGAAAAQGTAGPGGYADIVNQPTVQTTPTQAPRGAGMAATLAGAMQQATQFLGDVPPIFHLSRRREPIWLGYKRPENHHQQAAKSRRRQRA